MKTSRRKFLGVASAGIASAGLASAGMASAGPASAKNVEDHLDRMVVAAQRVVDPLLMTTGGYPSGITYYRMES